MTKVQHGVAGGCELMTIGFGRRLTHSVIPQTIKACRVAGVVVLDRDDGEFDMRTGRQL